VPVRKAVSGHHADHLHPPVLGVAREAVTPSHKTSKVSVPDPSEFSFLRKSNTWYSSSTTVAMVCVDVAGDPLWPKVIA